MSKGPGPTAKATNDAYTGMLTISLIALVVGTILLYLDYSQYPDKNPPPLKAPAVVAPQTKKDTGLETKKGENMDENKDPMGGMN